MVRLDTSLAEEFLDVAVGQAEAQVPADSQHDHIGWEAEAGKCGARRNRPVGAMSGSHLPEFHRPDRPTANATEPASEIGQYGSCSTGRHDIALPPVAAEGFLGRFAGCMRTPGKPQYFGQVHEYVALHVDAVRCSTGLDRISPETFGLGGGAPSGEHFRPERPPEHLRHDVFGGGCFLTHLRKFEGLVMAALGVHRIPKEYHQRG
jgi:hypothetical protein